MYYGIIYLLNVLYEKERKIRNMKLHRSHSDFLLLFFLEGIYLYTNEKNTIKYTVKYDKTFNSFWRIPVLGVRTLSLNMKTIVDIVLECLECFEYNFKCCGTT